MVRVWLIAVLVLASGCNGRVVPEDTTHAAVSNIEPTPLPRAAFLRHMPINSDKRCVGIAVVAEALLDGVELEENGYDEVETIAQRVYDSLTTQQRVHYHRHVMLEGTRVPINSKAALDRLSTSVAQRYEQDYTRLTQTEAGRQKLMSAHYNFIATSRALDRILDDDPDKTAAFFGTGTRVFPDGRIEDTSHAYLLGKQPTGDMVVYDANDPGLPITCQVTNTEEGVVVEWTCRYRDTGYITTQSYLMVDQETVFGAMLGE